MSQLKSTVPKQKITATEKQKETEALTANPERAGVASPEGEPAIEANQSLVRRQRIAAIIVAPSVPRAACRPGEQGAEVCSRGGR